MRWDHLNLLKIKARNDNDAAFRQLRSQLNSLGTMLPTVSKRSVRGNFRKLSLLVSGADAPDHVHHLFLNCQQVWVPQHGLPPHRQAHSPSEFHEEFVWVVVCVCVWGDDLGSSSNFEWQILAFQDRTIWSGLKLFCQELNNLNKAGEFKESFSEPNKKRWRKRCWDRPLFWFWHQGDKQNSRIIQSTQSLE